MAKLALFNPSDMNLKVDFTTIKTVTSPVNGSQVKKPVVLFTKHGAFKTRSLNQQYQVEGTSLSDTLVIGVRHDPKIFKTLGVTVKGINYTIEDISPDETNHYIAFDLLTVKKVTK